MKLLEPKNRLKTATKTFTLVMSVILFLLCIAVFLYDIKIITLIGLIISSIACLVFTIYTNKIGIERVGVSIDRRAEYRASQIVLGHSLGLTAEYKGNRVIFKHSNTDSAYEGSVEDIEIKLMMALSGMVGEEMKFRTSKVNFYDDKFVVTDLITKLLEQRDKLVLARLSEEGILTDEGIYKIVLDTKLRYVEMVEAILKEKENDVKFVATTLIDKSCRCNASTGELFEPIFKEYPQELVSLSDIPCLAEFYTVKSKKVNETHTSGISKFGFADKTNEGTKPETTDKKEKVLEPYTSKTKDKSENISVSVEVQEKSDSDSNPCVADLNNENTQKSSKSKNKKRNRRRSNRKSEADKSKYTVDEILADVSETPNSERIIEVRSITKLVTKIRNNEEITQMDIDDYLRHCLSE